MVGRTFIVDDFGFGPELSPLFGWEDGGRVDIVVVQTDVVVVAGSAALVPERPRPSVERHLSCAAKAVQQYRSADRRMNVDGSGFICFLIVEFSVHCCGVKAGRLWLAK